jgi:hypothetical protein
MAVAFFVPFVAPVFTFILYRSYRRAEGAHRWWVRIAILAAATPWVLLAAMFFSLLNH